MPRGCTASNVPAVPFTYNGAAVTYDAGRMINLTEMWKAAGAVENRDPRIWRRREGRGFIADLALTLNVTQGHIIRGERGRGGSTWAHWQIALAYAKYLSHEFHRFVNEAFREWAEEKADPGLKLERAIAGYQRHGKDSAWIRVRTEGILVRHGLEGTLHNHGVEGVGYAACTDAINKRVLGGRAKQIKLARGLPAKARTLNHISMFDMSAVRFAEVMARNHSPRWTRAGISHVDRRASPPARPSVVSRSRWDRVRDGAWNDRGLGRETPGSPCHSWMPCTRCPVGETANVGRSHQHSMERIVAAGTSRPDVARRSARARKSSTWIRCLPGHRNEVRRERE